MNWLNQIRSILGKFWTELFNEDSFITGVENVLTLTGRSDQAQLDSWMASQFPADNTKYSCPMPFVIYLLKSRVVVDSGDSTVVPCIGRPAASVEAILNGASEIGDIDTDGGWLAVPRNPIPEPLFLTDHVVDYQRTLFKGADYDIVDGNVLFYVDPATLGFQQACFTDDKGQLETYYKVFGWRKPEKARKDAVCAFEDPALNDCADIVWDIHQNGATKYSSKQLLAAVTDSVVCKTDGAVDHYWTEQGYQCMRVGEHLYTAPQGVQRNFSHGDSVKQGDVLFGSLYMVAGTDIPDTGIPYNKVAGIRVRTDAGELVAPNVEQSAVVVSGINTLPLTGTGVVAYRQRCVELSGKSTVAEIPVPDTVNPFLFVMRNLRRGRSVFVSIVTSTMDRLAAAIKCLRRNTDVANMITVHISAESDTVNVPSSFTADVGNAAVAVDATVTIQSMFADAESFI